jgi:uncharacterized protein (TIGR02996 family)
MREVFEQAIEDNPDDPASYAAYGDWLTEQDDPALAAHGEFIQVQLALEDPACLGQRRTELQNREKELLELHQEEWLGALAAFLPPRGMPAHVVECMEANGGPPLRFARGFLHSLRPGVLTVPLARALRDAPQVRFLRELVLEWIRLENEDDAAYEAGEDVPADLHPDAAAGIYPLRGRDSFPCLRYLRIGDEVNTDVHWPDKSINHYVYVLVPLVPLLKKMPRLEELHLLCKDYDADDLFSSHAWPRLRVLRIYHLGAYGTDFAERRPRYEYPLDVLAANPAFGNLTHLLLHPHMEEGWLGEDWERVSPSFLPLPQVEALVKSPYLTKLTHLQMRLSDMGDAGCRALVDSGILRRLKWLDLRYGCISDEGARILASCPDLKHLEYLDLGRNALTPEGIALLEGTGVPGRADDQLAAAELAERRYLFEGDNE